MHVYLVDFTEQNVEIPPEQTLEILMSGLPEETMQQFFQKHTAEILDKDSPDTQAYAREVTVSSGIADLIPGSTIDSYVFDPCGYSMNGSIAGIDDRHHYWTIHVTPESHCSYVSFETSMPPSAKDGYTSLVNAVLNVFKPARFIVQVFADDHAVFGHRSEGSFNIQMPGFRRLTHNVFHFEGDYNMTMASYEVRDKDSPTTKKPPQAALVKSGSLRGVDQTSGSVLVGAVRCGAVFDIKEEVTVSGLPLGIHREQ